MEYHEDMPAERVAPHRRSPAAQWEALAQGWDLSLAAGNKAPRTRQSYLESLQRLRQYLEDRTRPLDVSKVTRRDLEGWVADLLERWAPATASVRYRAMQSYFKWLVNEGELERSPMEGMPPPHVPEVPVPILQMDDLRRLLATCAGRTYEDRRDQALLRCLIDTGLRLSELAGLKVSDIDWDLRVLGVLGKGRRPRAVPFGNKTGLALNRYLRARDEHPAADKDSLWLGHAGPMTDRGVAKIVERRAGEAGLTGVHPHRFRHTFAHEWLSAAGNEGDLMQLTGWRSRSMLQRYASSAAAERAREAYQRLALGDRL